MVSNYRLSNDPRITAVARKTNSLPFKHVAVGLGGLVASCLPLDPKFAGSNPDEDEGFLRAIQIRRTTWGSKAVGSML
jgi:hypothetical protein